MSAINTPSIAEAELQADLAKAVDRLVNGHRDAKAIQRACERMDRMREEMRKRTGEIEVAVNLIREIRDDG
jgi:hypothetical protein